MRTPNVSVIIPNWNGKKLLWECLGSLKGLKYPCFEVIVVDNGSTDGSIELLNVHYPEVKTIELEKNLGFAKAVNLGINRSRAKYVALLNNDTRVEKGWLSALVYAMENDSSLTAVTSKVILMSGGLDSVGDVMNSVGQACHRGHGDNPGKWITPGYVFLVTAGASLYKRSSFIDVGLFDESFFAYGEDVDWCLRAQLYCCKFWYEPKAIVCHHHKATSKRIPKKVEYLQFRNMTLSMMKNFPLGLFLRKWRFITIPLVHLNTIVYMSLKGFLKEALLADFWIFVRLLKILKERRRILKRRRASIEYLDEQMVPKKIRLYGFLK